MSALSTCPPESSFLSSWQYLAYPMQYSNIIFIPLALLAGYCILVQTPKQMQPIKWVTFNLHFWITFQCIYVSLLVTPLAWLPTLSTTLLGLLSMIGVSDVLQAHIACSSLIISMSATVTLFENRHQQIQRNRFRLSSSILRFGIQAFNYLYSVLYSFPIFLDIPDQATAKQAFLEIVPCPYEDFFTLPFYTFTMDPLLLAYFAFALMSGLVITVTQIIFYSSTCLYYLVFDNYTGSSKVTTDRQKRFFLGILVQISIPYVLMSPIMVYASWSMLTGYYSQKLNNVVMVTMGLYGTVATLALLIIHSPYRDFIKGLIGFSKQSSAQLSTVRDQRGVGSWPYLVYPLHYSNVLFIPMSILAGYCILVKTPKAMQPMKWVYFNLHVWISFQSVYVSLLVTPYVWVPTFSGSFLGLLGKVGVSDVLQAYVGCNTLIVSMSATVSLFENRHQQIQRNRYRLSSRTLRYSIQALNYLYAILYPFPVYRDTPNQTQARFDLLRAIPCPFEDFFTLPFYAFSIDPLMQTYFAISLMIGVLITISQLIFYSSTCLYYLVFNQPSHSSRVTNTRQKKFFLGILVQISIPYALMSPGMMYVSWSMLTGYYSQKLNNLAFLILGTYGIAATLALLLIHSPYREFVKQLIGIQKKTSNQGSGVGDKRGAAFASV